MEKLLTVDGIPHDGNINATTKCSVDFYKELGNLGNLVKRIETSIKLNLGDILWKDIISIDIKTGIKFFPFKINHPIYYANGEFNLKVGGTVFLGDKQCKVKLFKYNSLLDCTKLEVE